MLIRKPISRLKPGETFLGMKNLTGRKKPVVKSKTVKKGKHGNKNNK